MKQVRLFSCCFISVVMLLHIALALPVKQGGLRKKLDDLEIETQEQNIQRRKEIKELYTMMESLEERLNNTSPIVDTSGDITDATHMSTGAVHVAVDEQRIAKVLKEFVRLKQGMRDEKRLAVDLRAQVGELNITLGQLISQSGQAMDAVNRSFGEVNTKIQTTVLGQDQLKTVVSAIQDDLERQADETGRLIMNLEIELQDLSRSVVHKISSCVEHMKHGKTMSGVYDIALPNPSSVKVKVSIPIQPYNHVFVNLKTFCNNVNNMSNVSVLVGCYLCCTVWKNNKVQCRSNKLSRYNNSFVYAFFVQQASKNQVGFHI